MPWPVPKAPTSASRLSTVRQKRFVESVTCAIGRSFAVATDDDGEEASRSVIRGCGQASQVRISPIVAFKGPI